MPNKPAKPCKNPGCPLQAVRLGRCAVHAAEYEAQRKQQLAEVDVRRGTASQRGYGLKWRRIRAQFLKAHPTCAKCGAVATEVHHVKTLRAGGSNKWENLQALCHSCHSAITMRESVPQGPGNQGW